MCCALGRFLEHGWEEHSGGALEGLYVDGRRPHHAQLLRLAHQAFPAG